MSVQKYKDNETGRVFEMNSKAFGRTLKGIKFTKGGKKVERYTPVAKAQKSGKVGNLNAEETIEHIKTLEEVPAIQAYLEDERKTVREAAAERMEELGNE